MQSNLKGAFSALLGLGPARLLPRVPLDKRFDTSAANPGRERIGERPHLAHRSRAAYGGFQAFTARSWLTGNAR
jgi:hypothetical protein